MINTFKLPADAVKYLLWQQAGYRSELLKTKIAHIISRCTRKKEKDIYMKYLAGSWVEKLRREKIGKLFYSDVAKISEIMGPELPRYCEKILDIGCGIGGIDVYLYHEYLKNTNKEVELWMLDKDDDAPMYGRHYAGYNEIAAAYNSLKITQKFLEYNKIPKNRINLVNIEKEPYPSEQEFDIVISLLAWGFHFPVDVYLDRVKKTLKKFGVLFIDIRKNTDGIDKLKLSFKSVNILLEGRKNRFICARN